MKRHCLLIANGVFGEDPQLIDLVTPEKDLEGLAATLSDPSRGGFDAKLLLNEDAATIKSEIDVLIKRADPEDLVLIYYSGHGLLDAKRELYLAGRDTKTSMRSTHVEFEHDVAELLDEQKQKRAIVLLDCCYSGAAASGKQGMIEFKGSVTDELRSAVKAKGGFDELPEEKGASLLDSPGDGVFMMTACSPVELARGNTSLGHGLFTSHLIAGIKEGALVHFPKDKPTKSIVTVRNLFTYAYKKLLDSGQTPMLFRKGDGTDDMWITEATLPVPEQTHAAFLGSRNPRLSLLDNLGPAYFLDAKFCFVDWNAAFDSLIASPLKLRRGHPADAFLKVLDNYRAVYERSLRVFDPASYPTVYIERFDYRSTRFGLIVFRKVASRIWDCGEAIWCVQLDIEYAQYAGELWDHLQDIMKREANWTRYAECYDEIIGKFPPYQDLCRQLAKRTDDSIKEGRKARAQEAGGAAKEEGVDQVLDAGAGTGNSTFMLLDPKYDPEGDRRVTAIERNNAMFARLEQKHHAHPARDRVHLVRENMLTFLEAAEGNSFDACTMLNVLFALDEPEKCLKEIHRVLKPKGGLVLSSPRKSTDIHRLFGEIRKHYKLTEPDVRREGHALHETYNFCEQAFTHNKEMETLIRRYSVEELKGLILLSNFRIVQEWDNQYLDCVVVIRAEKIPIVHAKPARKDDEPEG